MIIKTFLIAMMLFVSNSSFSQSDILGKWKNRESGSIVEIYNLNNMFFGKIIHASEDNSKVKTGQVILNNMVYEQLSKRYVGEVKTTSGISASCEIELLNQNSFELNVRKLFFKKTQTFERTD